MVKAHGGDVRVVEQPERLANAKAKFEVVARRSGYVSECDAYALGMSGIALGAGRTRADQAVDPSAGIELFCAARRASHARPAARGDSRPNRAIGQKRSPARRTRFSHRKHEAARAARRARAHHALNHAESTARQRALELAGNARHLCARPLALLDQRGQKARQRLRIPCPQQVGSQVA